MLAVAVDQALHLPLGAEGPRLDTKQRKQAQTAFVRMPGYLIARRVLIMSARLRCPPAPGQMKDELGWADFIGSQGSLHSSPLGARVLSI